MIVMFHTLDGGHKHECLCKYSGMPSVPTAQMYILKIKKEICSTFEVCWLLSGFSEVNRVCEPSWTLTWLRCVWGRFRSCVTCFQAKPLVRVFSNQDHQTLQGFCSEMKFAENTYIRVCHVRRREVNDATCATVHLDTEIRKSRNAHWENDSRSGEEKEGD